MKQVNKKSKESHQRVLALVQARDNESWKPITITRGQQREECEKLVTHGIAQLMNN